jgi:hypothetical protein
MSTEEHPPAAEAQHHEREALELPERGVPAWLAIMGVAVGIFISASGAVGSYAIMSWRVNDTDKKLEVQAKQIEDLREKQASQAVLMGEVKIEMTNIGKNVEGLDRRQSETNALLREVIAHLPSIDHSHTH